MAAAAETEIGHLGRRLRESLRRKNMNPPAQTPMINTANRCQTKIVLRRNGGFPKKVGFHKKAHSSQTSARLLGGRPASGTRVTHPTDHVLNLCRRLFGRQRDQ